MILVPLKSVLVSHLINFSYTIREQVLDDGLVSELSILQTYRQDTGALTCRASNTYGQDEMLIHLVVQEVRKYSMRY